MTSRIGKGPKADVTSKATKTRESKPKAETKKADAASKNWGTGTAKASDKQTFPRAGWKDTNKLSDAISKSAQDVSAASHPRLKHTGGGTGHNAPPIVMRYGVFPVHPDPLPVHPQPPPIVMRYGVFPVHPNPQPPPIVMRYGVFPVHPNPQPPNPAPPIVMRYGVFPVHPQPPPIVMRYGLVPTHPR